VDVIHAHSTKASLLAAWASWLTGVPSVYTPHAWAFDREGSPAVRKAYAAFERAMARTHKEIIAVAESERRAASRAGIRPLGGTVRLARTGLPAGLDVPTRAEARSALRLALETNVVAWVGRRAAQKRPQDLAPLAALLRREGIQLVAAGWELADAPQGRALLAEHGRILPEDVDPAVLYSAADMFVQTSAWEANPLSVLEAMRASLPVVAYRIGGLPELVQDGITGYLVPPGAVESLALRLIKLAGSPIERSLLGDAGRRRCELCFPFQGMLDKIESTYWSAIAQRDAA
jgi:glycosyltransferase involved in cell wall biosynthesis